MEIDLKHCMLCPRLCGADRTQGPGPCGGGAAPRVARAALHQWEEPPVSGTRGSGTVFFSGCPLQCCFCQNAPISAGNFGKEITVERLTEIFLTLQRQGAHNINLVSAGHYAFAAAQALEHASENLRIPVVFNSGGYERVETLRMLEGLVQVYLPDLKYKSEELARTYSSAPDYFHAASAAIAEMVRQAGPVQLDGEGLIRRGVIIRHLVLPGAWRDSLELMEFIARSFPIGSVFVSVMSQYTPAHRSCEHPEINRRVTTWEYQKVVERALELGLPGFMQDRRSAREEYTPPFDLEGV